ncbi:MAG: hypothetical protein LBV17_04905 [Treponema sp.]|nr:hypothetical protein [Treponema sp.]
MIPKNREGFFTANRIFLERSWIFKVPPYAVFLCNHALFARKKMRTEQDAGVSKAKTLLAGTTSVVDSW